MDTNIYATIRQEINDFTRNPIYPVEGYAFYQYDTIKRIHLYENSQFSSGRSGTSNPLDQIMLEEEDDRIFYNISNPRRDAVKRFIDVDVKDVSIEEINPLSERPIMLLNEDFRRYAERVNLSKIFNDINHCRTTFGSAVIKTNGKFPTVVDLRRLFLDPTVDSIKQSRFVTIKHLLTKEELRDKVKDGWDADKIEKIISVKERQSSAPESYEHDGNVNQIRSSHYFEVYERYGYASEKFITGNGNRDVKSVMVVVEPFNVSKETDSAGNEYNVENGETLFKSKWNKEWPFRDTHFSKTKGRWLGIGIFEILFPAQERFNELVNQKRISMSISALHLFQTADPTALNNLLTDLQNGDLFKTKTPNAIQPINTEERNLPAFVQEDALYQRLADSVTFANDLVTGADVPSSTPATNVVVQNNNLLSVHLNNREEFTNFISYYIKDFVVPELIKDTTDAHYISILQDGEDMMGIDNAIVNLEFKRQVMEKVTPEMLVDPEGYKETIKTKLRTSSPKRYVKVYQNYYKEKIGDVIVHVDNEKKDIAKMANNTMQFYQITSANPEALTNPVNKLLLTSYARDIGIDTSKLELAFAKSDQMAGEAQARAKAINVKPQKTQEEELEAKVG